MTTLSNPGGLNRTLYAPGDHELARRGVAATKIEHGGRRLENVKTPSPGRRPPSPIRWERGGVRVAWKNLRGLHKLSWIAVRSGGSQTAPDIGGFLTKAAARSVGRRRLQGADCALLLAVVLGIVSSSFAAIPPPEKLLPDDTLIMVTAPDFARMREVWKHCPQTRLWNDPAMKPFKDKFVTRWKEEFVQPLERDLGVRFDDYGSLPQGQVTFALTQNGWQGSGSPSPAVLLLLDTKDKKDQLKKILDDLRKKWVDAGKSIRTEKIRGIEFSIVPISSSEVPKTLQKALSPPENAAQPAEEQSAAPKTELTVGQFESLLIVGSSTAAVEKILAHLTGGAMPALGDLAAYEANRLALFRDAPFYGWVNLKSFIDVLTRKPAENEETTGSDPMSMLNPGRLMTATGLSSLKTLAFNFQNSNEGSSVQVMVGAPEAGRQGILKLLPARGKESTPPSFVPVDVVKFQRCRIDGQQAWATLQQVINDINPQWLGGLNFLLDTANTAARQKDPDFDIRKCLFNNLGDDMISYQKAPRGNSPADSNGAPWLFLMSSPQPEQLAAALKSIGVLWNPQGGFPAEREFLGRKIFALPLPGMPLSPADPSSSAPRALNCAASGGYVALSTDASILEEYLRSSESRQKTLGEKPGLTEAAARVGGTSTGWFGYQNQLDTGRAALDIMRKGASDPITKSIITRSVFLGLLYHYADFSLLPSFDQISKYFYFEVYTASANADGVTFKWFAPTPPGLRK